MADPWQRHERIGGCDLYLGDCLEVMPHLGRVDAVVTDPPYGVGRGNGMGNGGRHGVTGKARQSRRYGAGEWDDERPGREAFDAILSLAPAVLVWGGNYFADILPEGGRWLIWDKVNNMPSFSDAELCWTTLPGSSLKMFRLHAQGSHSNRDGERAHPTQKPLALMEWCLDHIPEAEVILDPFAGSGTTLVAVAKAGKRGIGIERSPEYFDAMCRRVREAYAQPNLFVTQPPAPPIQEVLL